MHPIPFRKTAHILLLASFAAGCLNSSGSFHTVRRTREKANCFAVVNGKIWVGTSSGLEAFSKDGGDSAEFGEKSGFRGRQSNVLGIFPDARKLILATSAGILVFDPANGKVAGTWTSKEGLGSDSVRQVFKHGNELWAATIFGASKFDPRTGKWKNYSEAQGLPKRHIYAFAAEGKTLWASSMNGGLIAFSPTADRWNAIPRKKGIGNTHIYDIEPSPEGLWLGTASGVNFYSVKDGKWDERICADGFTDYTVYALKRDGTNLWFGTSFGLYKRDLSNGKQKLFTDKNGLPGSEIVALQIVEDTLWVCTREGIARLKGSPGL